MAGDIANADTIITEIDEGALRPTTHLVVRALHRHMRLETPVQRKALDAFDRGAQATHKAALQDEIWALMRVLPVEQQSGLRLSNCLVRPNEAVDWYLAGYLVLWARQQGLSEQQITDAFHIGLNHG